ncbi:hypothetical protein PYCC9005_005640 [Savitreella phatthalungensis]
MHFTTALALSAAGASAFPHMAVRMAEQLKAKRDAGVDGGMDIQELLAKRQLLADHAGFPSTSYDAAAQTVCNSKACGHEYIPADFSKGDIRGPCPGLNAAANHGYIARNGVTNLQEAIEGTNAVFSMSTDLGGFLSLYSVLQDGDLMTQKWSIGGQPPSGGGLGLTGSHNKYETDSSPMRGDLYEYGNNFKLQMSQFQSFYDRHRGEKDPAWTFDGDIIPFRSQRFTESIEQNPYFYYGAFTGIQVSQAAFTFIRAFMANYSAEFPNGRLNRKSLRSFMGIQVDDETVDYESGTSKLTWVPGTERIPDNWHKRPPSNPYSIPSFQQDVLRIGAVDPRILSAGYNSNGVNTYVSVPPTTSSNYNPANFVANPTSFNCFFYQTISLAFADALKQAGAGLILAAQPIISQLVPASTCPSIELTKVPAPKTPA